MIIEINRKRHLWELWLWIYFTRRFHIYRTWAKLSLTFCILIYKGIQMDWINMTAFYIFITIFVCFCLFVEINKIPKRWKALQKKEKKNGKKWRWRGKKKLNEFSRLCYFSLYFIYFILIYFTSCMNRTISLSPMATFTRTPPCVCIWMSIQTLTYPIITHIDSFFFPRGKQMKLQAKC